MIPAPLVEPYRQYESSADEVFDLRLRLLAAEEEVLLSKDDVAYWESTVWQEVEGPNETMRKANFTVRLQDHEDYQKALTTYRAKQHVAGRLQAELERAIDRRRGFGWIVRSVAGVNAPSSDDA